MKFDRRLITYFDWELLLTVVALSVVGLINLYSASSTFEASGAPNYFRSQLLWFALGLLALVVVLSLHYRYVASMSFALFGLSLVLLVLVLLVGKSVAGHQSWIQLAGFRLQPTELAKLGLILALARHLAKWNPERRMGFYDLLPSLGLFLLPTVLVMLQGDLGSSLFFGLIYSSMVLVVGVRWKVVVSLAASLVVVALSFYFLALSDYQKDRIHTFLDPERDPRGAGYHLVQSKIAVGSGGFMGKGYLKGQTHQLKFVPERHTDFIFPVLAEEWGFVGSFVVLSLFFTFLALGLKVAYKAVDRYSFLLVVGLCALFFWHFVINLGGVLGLMPLTGVPLPFLSYGGSQLLTSWIAVGFILNVSMRRFLFG